MSARAEGIAAGPNQLDLLVARPVSDRAWITDVVTDDRVSQEIARTRRRAAHFTKVVTDSTRAVQLESSLKSDVAITLAGAYAGGFPTGYADVEVNVISRCGAYDARVDMLCTTLARKVDKCVLTAVRPCLQAVDIDIDTLISTLGLKYIMGSRAVFEDAVSSYRRFLIESSVSTLHAMYENDHRRNPWRRDPRSPLYHDLQYGYGGMVDYDYAQLLFQRAALRGEETSNTFKEAWIKARLAHRFLLTLSDNLGRKARSSNVSTYRLKLQGVPWYFRPATVDRVRGTLVGAVDEMISDQLRTRPR